MSHFENGVTMPARKIRQGHRSVRGYFPSRKNGRQMEFESTFERDLFYLLELNVEVLSYEEQPIQVDLIWAEETWRYTPDVMVDMRSCDRPLIYEVKPSLDDFPVTKKKAMDHWCKSNGFIFEVIDASKIRTPELDRAKFLYPYRRILPERSVVDSIINTVSSEPCLTIANLTSLVGCRLGEIYQLIATNQLSCEGMPSSHSVISISEAN